MTDSRSEETGMLLVANLIGELQKQFLAGVSALANVQSRLDVQSAKLDQIHTEVRRTNGRVTEIETWRDGFQDETEQAAAYSAGVEKRIAEERKVAHSIWRIARPYALIAATALIAGAGARVAAFFLGVSW